MKNILYIALLLVSCSKKITIQTIKPIPLIEEHLDSSKKLYLSGEIYPIPEPKQYYTSVLLLHYNDSTKIFASSDFDGRFAFYDFKPELINKESYIYAVNKGCIAKRILFDSLKNPIRIYLVQDSIKGLSYDAYIDLLIKNRPID